VLGFKLQVYNGISQVQHTNLPPTLPCRRNEQCFQRSHRARLL